MGGCTKSSPSQKQEPTLLHKRDRRMGTTQELELSKVMVAKVVLVSSRRDGTDLVMRLTEEVANFGYLTVEAMANALLILLDYVYHVVA
ncbi:hypothetical protein RIF29_29781 [Crotalaria pallida]|uniref:Uncharacterized protein n=1 Tax=Crotalaria pallida TaxID=3830 RepID=A0AAN9EG23_CROPI